VIRPAIVRTVFRKELREMLRDRRSLAVMFGLPLVLYPLLAIGIATLGKSRQQQLTDQPARVSLENGNDVPELMRRFNTPGHGIQAQQTADPEKALDKGVLDAVVTAPPKAEERAIAGESVEFTVRLDRSRSAARFVEQKITKVLEDYERWVLEQRLRKFDAPAKLLEPLKTETIDIASGEKVFGRVLSQMLPLLLLMTGMLGALFPALNATTTERELGTLETLLVTPAGRMELLLAKGALVLLSALLTAGLNMLSMSLVLLKSISIVEQAANFRISTLALLLSYVAAVPALIFFSAIVLIVGLLARNFREANSFATPTMLLPLTSLAVGIAEPDATAALLLTPVANTTVIIREVLTGRASFAQFALAFLSSCLYAGIVLSLAARVFSSEQLVNPAWEPLSLRGLRRNKGSRPRRLPTVDAAMFLFVVALLLLFYLNPSPKSLDNAKPWDLPYIAAVNELLFILAPTLLFAYFGRWKWTETFLLREPSRLQVIGAALAGIGAAPLVQLVSELQKLFWPESAEQAKAMGDLVVPALVAHPFLMPIAIGALAGICEELMFRGAIQTAFVRRIPPWGAIFLTAILFGALHFDVHGLPIRTGLGVLLGWVTWRGKSILPAMLAHGLYDATVLANAAWQIHVHGKEIVTAPPKPGIHLTTFDLVTMGIGAAMVVIGVLLIRTGLKHSSSTEES
jgi:sodium transport system permease protein